MGRQTQQYEQKLDDIKKAYNKQFNEETRQKTEGVCLRDGNDGQKLPLYEERKITDLQVLEEVLGPLSLQRKYTGFRTVAGQMTVIVAVNSPVRLVYDECDSSLQLQFTVSPILEESCV